MLGVMLSVRHRITEAPGSNYCRSERPSRRLALSGSMSTGESRTMCGSHLLCVRFGPIGQFVLVLWGLFVAVVGYIGGLSRFDSTSWLDISCWF